MPIAKDPLYVVIAGVGGQGNILLSRLLGRAFLRNGYSVTIVDTYGAAHAVALSIPIFGFQKRNLMKRLFLWGRRI